MNLYKVPEEKIEVVYEGANPMRNYELNSNLRTIPNTKYKILDTEYLLFIGRLEERKNIVGIIEAYKILKEKYKISHKLVLVGKFGFGAERIKKEIEFQRGSTSFDQSDQERLNLCEEDIILTGFVSEEEKRELLKNADVFLFPTLYEGFGLPILEAQSVGVPVVASNNSSISEVVQNRPPRSVSTDLGGLETLGTAILVNPQNPSEIAEAVYKLISDKALRDDIIKKGYENVKRFSWEKCVEEIIGLFKK